MTPSEGASCAHDTPRAETIARLNDKLRKHADGGTILMTRGVMALSGFEAVTLLSALANYDDFDADNDPHGERDFGDLEFAGASLLWKVDYYDTDLAFASPDPADAQVTRRVLTVMLAEEW